MLMYHWLVGKDFIERHADTKWENKAAVIDCSILIILIFLHGKWILYNDLTGTSD